VTTTWNVLNKEMILAQQLVLANYSLALLYLLLATNTNSSAGFVSQHHHHHHHHHHFHHHYPDYFGRNLLPHTVVRKSMSILGVINSNDRMEIDGSSTTSAFDALQRYISSLNDDDDHDDGLEQQQQQQHEKYLVKLVPSIDIPQYYGGINNNKNNNNNKATTEINSLIFQPKGAINGDSTVFAVVILPTSNTVDVTKLSSHLALTNNSYPKWELSPSAVVENLCGFKPGMIPPLGHSNRPLGVVIDRSLIPNNNNDKEDIRLQGGGGCLDYRCIIQSNFLRKCTNATVADVIKFDGRMRRPVNTTTNDWTTTTTTSLEQQCPKPFFQIAPPTVSTSSNPDTSQSPPHRPFPVTAIGRITSVRQISKRLVFADFAPPDYPVDITLSSYEKQEQYQKDMPWRSGEDGKDMYVQIIVGKTFCDQAGEVDGSDQLKLLKPGRLILIRGAVNVDPKQKNGWDNSAGNWAQKRSLDVILSSFVILAESEEVEEVVEEHMRTLGHLPWERKRQFQQRAVASTLDRRKTNDNEESMAQEVSTTTNSVLTVAQFNSQLQGTPLMVNIVDSLESIKAMANDVTRLSSQIENASEPAELLEYVLGLDCEWRPTGAYNLETGSGRLDDHPVALVQISIPALGKVYLVDTHKVLRPNLSQGEEMVHIEEVLSETISTIFLSMTIIKVGYKVAVDFRRLAGSFPHISAFRRVNSVVELSTLAKMLHPSSSLQSLGSLQRLTKLVLGYDISKEQQCSDWETRPLTPDQIEYATLDCALPPRLLDGMAEGAGNAEMKAVLPHCTSSWRFQTLDSDQKNAIRLLKAKRVVGDSFIVAQSWPSGNDVPAVPSVPEEGGGPYIDKSGIKRLPSHFVSISSDDGGQRAAWVDMVGTKVGKSKGKCIELLASNSITEGARLEYNPRSGFVPFQDGLALFVNMPNLNQSSRVMPYPNEWINKGQILTWYIRAKDWNNGQSDIANLLGFGKSNVSTTSTIALFARVGNAEFVFCGRCTASIPPESEVNSKAAGEVNQKLVKLFLRLNDWNSVKDSTPMRQLFESQKSSGSSVDASSNTSGDAPADIDSTALQERLASMVINGDVVGALGLAMDVSKASTKKRSIAAGVDCLKNILNRSGDAEVLRAVERLI